MNRKNLVNLFVLIDVRHTPQKIDLEFMEWCAESGIPFSIVFTKADKLKGMMAEKNADAYLEKMLETWDEVPNHFLTSSEKKIGTEDVLRFIEDTNAMLKNNKIQFV